MFSFFLSPKRRRSRTTRKATVPEVLTLPETDLSFTLQRDTFRTLRLIVKTDGSILVKASASVPLEMVMTFVRSRLDWIDKKRALFLQHKSTPMEYCDGGLIYCFGQPFRIAIVPARRGAKPHLLRGYLELPCRDERPELVEKAFKAWQQELAKLILARRLARLERLACRILGDTVRPSALTVRSLKRRWGSCSVRGEITLAAQLTAMPLPLIDYVICHELCHLRRMDHSPYFYKALLCLLPDAKEREKQLRIWSFEHPRT